ncbi:MAG: CHASE2 domain-containing protein [Verrucomicrobiota bacterium]|nr:CHASE2 domain-containing protein [Verrucomicrobiota bacterium]
MDWIATHRRLALACICAFCTVAILLTLLFPEVPFFSAVAHGEQSFGDLLRREGRKTATRDDMAFLGIDETTLNFVPFNPDDVVNNRAFQLLTEHPSPWSRELWAVTLDRLFDAGARLVLFDMMFGKPGESDEAFRAALDRYRERVVLVANFDLQSQIFIWPTPALIPDAAHDDRAGYAVFFPDSLDGKVRSVRYQISDRQLAGLPPHPSQEIFSSFSARGVQKLGQAASIPNALEPQLLRFSSADVYQPKPLWEIFDPKIWAAPVPKSSGNGSGYGDGAFFKNKIVVIGASSQVAHDVVDTPLTPSMSGPVLHLHAIAAALAGEFLRPTPVWLRYVLIGGSGLAAWLLVAFQRRPVLSLVAICAVTVAYLGLARLLYDFSGLLLLTVPVLAVFVLGGAFSSGFDYILERREKVRTRRTLERYVSKNLVKEILENPHGFYSTAKGARKPVTVLFSDLIGFTTLSERADPEELVRQLNEYLSGMVAVVFENEGTLDKFIGDAIMAVWGNVRSQGPEADARAAARTALGMRRALKKLNEGWRAEGRMGLGMGIGINQGEALVGNIGSYAPHERLDPTVIGDAVNLASRLEALTRTYAVDILVGPTATELIRDHFHLRSVARVQVKGKTVPVEVSTIVAEKGEEVEGDLLKWVAVYEEGFRNFRDRDFTQAKILFERFLESYPNDYLAKMYLDRALEYEQQPPDESWNAAEVFTKK